MPSFCSIGFDTKDSDALISNWGGVALSFTLAPLFTSVAEKHHFVFLVPAYIYVIHIWEHMKLQDKLFRGLVVASFIVSTLSAKFFWGAFLNKVLYAYGSPSIGAILLAAAIFRAATCGLQLKTKVFKAQWPCATITSMITNAIVEKACSVVGAYTDDQMMSEFDRFFEKQPGICDFVAELTSESTTEIQELSLFLSYMVFKAAETAEPDLPGGLVEISAERIESAFHESESWIDRIEQAQDQGSGLAPDDSEPFLVQYIISELNQPLENGTMLEDEQKGEVFFVLRTVISSFAKNPRRAQWERNQTLSPESRKRRDETTCG